MAAALPSHAADLFLNDEPEVYAAIDKLYAMGYLPGFLANTRPYSIQAVRNAADSASGALPGGFDGELVRWLASYAAPKRTARVTAAASYSDSRFLPPNNEGIPRPKGWTGLGSIMAREETTPQLSAQLRALSFRGEGGDEGNRLLDTSIEAGSKYAAVQAGKISAWYGPGRNGALILTNNAAPYPGVRFHNPVPIPMTGWLSFLGTLQYDFFAARMEKKPLYSHSMLVGTRLAARPKPWLEAGLSRVLHYGGEGRSNGISEFLTDFRGSNDPPDRSNSLYGFDITLTLPFRLQPVQAYWERAGEDSSHLWRIFVPWSDLWANLYGLYFPRVLGASRLDFRIEHADNFSGEAKGDNWYGHPAYPHRYRGDVLGHAMGADTRDWFFEGRYFIRPSTFASLSYERILHEKRPLPVGSAPGERGNRYSAGVTGWITKSWRGEVHASVEHVSGQGGVSGSEGADFSAFLGFSYQADPFLQ